MTESENVAEETQKNIMDSIRSAITVKGAARFVVGSSIRFVVSGAIASVVPVESRKDKVRVAVASYALSGLITEQAKDYVCNEIDDKIEFCRGVRDHLRTMNAGNAAAEADAPIVHDITNL